MQFRKRYHKLPGITQKSLIYVTRFANLAIVPNMAKFLNLTSSSAPGLKALLAIIRNRYPTMRQVRSPNGRFMKEETEYHAGRLHGEAQYGISGAGL